MKRKIYAVFVPLILALCIIGGVTFAANTNNNSFLSDYKEYGIIANFINQTGDMETTMLVGKYQSNGHTNGNTISDTRANAYGTIKIGEIIGSYQFRGTPVIIIDKSIQKEVNTALAEITRYANSVLDKNDYTIKEVTDMNHYMIDVTGIDKDTVYISADKLVQYINSSTIQNGALKIKKKAKQTIILNIASIDTVKIPRYQVISGGTRDEIAESVIWNMPNTNHLEIQSDNMQSTIIAPKAMVNINATGEGWLVCDTIVSNSGEWHMIYRKLPELTPTPKSTKTPEATETPEPTKTPVVTPEVTRSPEATNTPKPTPEITATPEPSSTPEVTPTPIPTALPKATTTPKNPGATLKPSTTPKTMVVVDENVPKTYKESNTKKSSTKSKEVTVLDDDVPLSDSAPDTGDITDLTGVMLFMILSLFFIVVILKMES